MSHSPLVIVHNDRACICQEVKGLSDSNLPVVEAWREAWQRVSERGNAHFEKTLARRTRQVYDRLAGIYPASTFFFHSRAHRIAIELAAIQDGSRVLEIATGSGEMFRRLLQKNPSGVTMGVDLSPNMAAVTLGRVRAEFPGHRAGLQAVDARTMPFPDDSFDSVMCCYLFELLDDDDIERTFVEVKRVLRPGGRFTMILIGDQTPGFPQAYKLATRVAPAFWGRLVTSMAGELIEDLGFKIEHDRRVRQGYYPSRVMVARKREA